MSDDTGFDLDRDTAVAWSRFQARLADRLAEMGDDDILLVEPEVPDDELDGASPYVQFIGLGDGSLRGEVSSSHYLDEAYAIDDAGVAALISLGWGPPTAGAGEQAGEGSANFHRDLPLTEADRLAVMAVTALRDVFGVTHPAFLGADGLEDDPAAPGPSRPETSATADEPLAVRPESADHLRDLVDGALTPLFGAAPEHDDDGDIPVPYGSSLVWVRVDDDSPVVDLFSVVIDGVTDRKRAMLEVGILNRDLRFMKLVLVEDRILARVHVPAWPFAPEHLRSMLTGMSANLDDLDEDLADRVGGRRAIEPDDDVEDDEDDEDDEDERVDEGGEDGRDEQEDEAVRQRACDDLALTTLLQLDVEASGAVDAELAASVCGFEQARVVRLLRQTERQAISWSQAADRARGHGDDDEADACDHEREAWERTSALLRRALRLVVERPLGRDTSVPARPTDDLAHRPPRPRSRVPGRRPPIASDGDT